MRNMSFSLTTNAILNRSKTVTRRLGWANLKAGQRVKAVKKGEKVEVLAIIEIVSNEPEPLSEIIYAPYRDGDENSNVGECDREGFPHMTPIEFVRMFRQHMGAGFKQIVNRIEFKYVETT